MLACSYSIKPTSYNAGRGPDNIIVQVVAPDGCGWTARSNASWVTVSDGATGSGSGAVRLDVDSNSGPPRAATITIAGIAFTLTQEGAAPQCSNSIDPTSRTVGPDRSDVNVEVRTASGCAWTAVSNDAWIAVADGSGGTGNGHVHLRVDSNTTMATRTGTVAIAGQTFTVQQAGIDCKYDIKPDHYDAGPGPDGVRIDVKAAPGCTWTTTNSGALGDDHRGEHGIGRRNRASASSCPTSETNARRSSRLPARSSGSNRRAHDGSRLPSYNLRGTIDDRGISSMRRREGQRVAARVAVI